MIVPPEIVAALGGNEPTPQQWEAISHDPSTPCAVVAGAGSGKTAVMAARVVWLTIEKLANRPGAMPSEILCLTFTNKACEELARRVRDATTGLKKIPEGEEATVLTYHAFAARLLDDYGLRMGIEAGPMLLSGAHRWQIASSLFEDAEFEHLEVRTVRFPVNKMLGLADQCADHLVDPDNLAEQSELFASLIEVKRREDAEARDTARERAELAKLVARYQARKRELGAIDYGDQIRLAVELVTNHPEVTNDFRRRYPIVLLDEYQDTNHAQGVLLKTLCGPGYPMMCVGDPDQNIYAWRGASLKNILRFKDDFKGTDRPLEVNFRSGRKILEVANAIIGKVPKERRHDKRLVPHESRGEGEVVAFVATDERAEAREIARIIKESGAPRKEIAVLCRKKRLFRAISEVLGEEGIEHEVVDLGGLLQLPEIVEVLAWLRVLDDPARNVALARILQGPRWRIGYRDLVALARWSGAHTKRLKDALDSDEYPGDVAFALGEALDHLDDADMEALSAEAKTRLHEFRQILATLRRAATDHPLDELVSAVIEESGLMRELEAGEDAASTSAKRNLLNFVGVVGAFAPLQSGSESRSRGDATLRTLIEWLDAAEDAQEELEVVQVSEADTVKLLTVHKAKGLEWDVVFVPGLAEGPKSKLFPDTGRQPNPLTQAQTLPFELRGDRDVLPAYPGRLDEFRKLLAARAEEEERRLCYVAMTRARKMLVASCAYWYEGPKEPFAPGRFYKEIAEHPETEALAAPECPAESPLVEARRARAGGWPPPAGPLEADPLFEAGWHAAAAAAARDPATVKALASSVLDADTRATFEARLAGEVERIGLVAGRAAAEAGPEVPRTLSVSALLTHERCPKQFYWTYVRPLPRRPSAAAALGTEIHRWIETASRGEATLFDEEEAPPDLSPEERSGAASDAGRLKEAFRRSRFASMRPLAVERPFTLYLDGFAISGRIDAIFGEPGGPWEVVDYKTGAVPPDGDPVAGLQLDVYALACQEVWGKRAEDLTLTYFYVGEEKEVSRRALGGGETAKRVGEVLAGLRGWAAGPGEQCHWCDFLRFCEPGLVFTGAGGSSG
jgi:DNA helicase-2/ATP-dependent DNA helicase PcrA